MIEARQKGFFLNPGPQNTLDDDHPDVTSHLADFTQYGSDMRGAQRERRAGDPHVPCSPPEQTFMTVGDVQWILQQITSVDEEGDFFGTEKYSLVLHCVDQLSRR